MASGLTTGVRPHDTGAPARASALDVGDLLASLRAAVVPWLVARIIVVGIVLIPDQPPGLRLGRLIRFDGGYFTGIAFDGYNRPYVEGVWSEWPFFPLYPAINGVLFDLDVPRTVALLGVSWGAALVATAGAHRLAVRHLPARAVPWAPWFLAVTPGALTMVMGYADSLYLAGLVWAVVFAEDRRWWLAGLLGAVATASRPNGWIAVVALVVIVHVARAGWRALGAVALPSAVFLIGWCWYLWTATDDPFVFYSAKSAWDEITLGELVADPISARHSAALFHLLAVAVLAVPYLMRVRSQPPAWAAIVVLSVVPSLLLGVEGLARYAVLAFPVPLAMADVLTSRRLWPAAAGLAVSAIALGAFSYMLITRTWLP